VESRLSDRSAFGADEFGARSAREHCRKIDDSHPAAIQLQNRQMQIAPCAALVLEFSF
jgi:hypothetical protein